MVRKLMTLESDEVNRTGKNQDRFSIASMCVTYCIYSTFYTVLQWYNRRFDCNAAASHSKMELLFLKNSLLANF